MPRYDPNKSRLLLITRFTLIFFVFILFFSFIIYRSFQRRLESVMQQTRLEEQSDLAMLHDGILTELSLVVSDLQVISQLPALMKYLNQQTDENLAYLGEGLLLFVKYRNVYDQLRFLDLTGQEVARVNYVDGIAQIVPADKLQSKKDRYYFLDSVGMNQGEIYISVLDLNMEYGAVELPFKPVIRFVTTVFDESGRKRGVLVINYLAQGLMRRLSDARLAEGRTMMINQDGYYLFNEFDPQSAWGFMLPDRQQRKFMNDYPDEWNKINSGSPTQFETNNGLFTTKLLSPVESKDMINYGRKLPKVVSQPEWRMIVIFPQKDLKEIDASIRDTYKWLGMLLIIASLILAGFFTWGSIELQHEQRLLRFNALHDGLTGLPNRLLFMDRLLQAKLRLSRDGTKFALFMMDLDGFKTVNDTLGHEAGDEVLKNAADCLASSLRESDTVARFGGDEFCVIVNGISNERDVLRLAERILICLGKPTLFRNQEAMVTGSIGITLQMEANDLDTDMILKQADDAMYEAKQNGKNQIVIYRAEGG